VRYRILKAANTLAYVGMIWLTWRFVDGELHWRLAIGAAALSGCWLALTYVKTNHLLKTYFDVLSRVEFALPAAIGVLLALFALVRTHLDALRVLAGIELVAWACLVVLYRRNRVRYVRQGHGPLPTECWVSPPSGALRAGDLILASGRVAAGLRESVGHGETIVRMPDGSLGSFSSYMGRGVVLGSLDEFTERVRAHGHYIALRLREDMTPEQLERAAGIAREMLQENEHWREASNRQRRRLVEVLPIPRAWKRRLFALLRADGYDWLGLFMGRLAPHRWTCIGACLELYRRAGVRTNPYGTGLLGFGTTLLDPIMPVRFLSDPAFRPLSRRDAERHA
jgi:hypothetical protein